MRTYTSVRTGRPPPPSLSPSLAPLPRVGAPFATPSFSSSSSWLSSSSSSSSSVCVSLYRSPCPPRRSSLLLLLLLFAFRPTRAPFDAASCAAATVNHSACDCVRLITVIRLLPLPAYRTLIIIIDSARTSLPCFHATRSRARLTVHVRFVRLRPRMCGRTDGTCPVAGKTCHSAAYTRDLWRFTVTEAGHVAKRRALRYTSIGRASSFANRTVQYQS